jgi:hypothetical protein
MQDSHALAILGFRPTRCFEGFPYLVTRVVPTMYHIVLLPDDLGLEDLHDIVHGQAHANALPTCLALGTTSALYVKPDGSEYCGEPPKGGVIVTDRLRSCRTFADTPTFAARRLALHRFIAEATPTSGYMLGDLTKGGRPATLEETVLLAGRQANGVPRGLSGCERCGEWRGRCLDPSPEFAGQAMDVHCRCDNDNRCAACGGLLYERKLNANYYDAQDGHLWHVPGFSGFRHRCAAGGHSAGRPDSRQYGEGLRQ